MTDSKALRELIDSNGLKYTFLAKKLGLSCTGFLKKIDNVIEFKPSEIQLLCELLHIKTLQKKNDIFFKKQDDKKSTLKESEVL